MPVLAVVLALAVWLGDAVSKASLPTLVTTNRMPLALLIAALILVLITPGRKTPVSLAARGLIIGGALGNLTDLIVLGHIRDVFVLRSIVFNVADAAILVGLTVWLIAQLRMVY